MRKTTGTLQGHVSAFSASASRSEGTYEQVAAAALQAVASCLLLRPVSWEWLL